MYMYTHAHTHTHVLMHALHEGARPYHKHTEGAVQYTLHYELRNTEGSTPCTARAPQRECSAAAPSVQLHARPPCAHRTPTHRSHTPKRSATAVCHRHSAAVSGASAAVTVVGWALPLPRSVWVCRASAASICGRVYTCGYTCVYVCIRGRVYTCVLYTCVYMGGYIQRVYICPLWMWITSLLAC